MAADPTKPAVDFALRWTNAFPKPGPQQAVRGDALLAAFRALVPLASRVAALAVGSAKAKQPGIGYLTGPAITQKDVFEAKLVLAATTTLLPALGRGPVDATLLQTLKAAGQWVLMVGTDLSTERTLLDKAADFWSSKDAIVDPLVNLAAGAADAAARAAEIAWRAATEPWLLRAAAGEARDQLGVGGLVATGLLVLGGGFVLLKLLGR